jgi:UDP-N-acetylmuramate--alanine ligase
LDINKLKKIYFVGIGGIGMSALARYFIGRGIEVHGYDKTETDLTLKLAAEGMKIHYEDNIAFIPEKVDLVVYTPAIPKDHTELNFFQARGYKIYKRSEVLGMLSRGLKTIAVAGTHGKTTTSSLVTHILRTGGVDCTAFLGGISNSLGSNFIQGKSDWVVVEADEYDRSFLQLSPDIALVMSMDADHLDIYENKQKMHRAYNDFIRKTKDNGKIFRKAGLPLTLSAEEHRRLHLDSFGVEHGSYQAKNVRVKNGFFVFDLKSPIEHISEIKLAMAGLHNVENATAAIAAAQQLGIKSKAIKQALESFKGIKRRFEIVFTSPKTHFVDDYAHHPTELQSAIHAAKLLYPDKKILGIFQPHLFSRTRDFQEGFAEALDALDELLLMDIYPAREYPIEGVTSEIIFDKMQLEAKQLVTKSNLMEVFKQRFEAGAMENTVVLTVGAGDIDTFVRPIRDFLKTNIAVEQEKAV